MQMHKSEILFYCFTAFIGGVFVASLWSVSTTWILVLLILGVAVIAVTSYHRTFSKSKDTVTKRKLGILTGFLVVFFIFGTIRFNSFNYESSFLDGFSDSILVARNDRDVGVVVILKGYVDGESDKTGNKTRFSFKAKEVTVGNRTFNIDERTLITTDIFPEYNFGDRLTIVGTLKKPQSLDAFDYVTYLKKDGIRTVMSFPKISKDLKGVDLGLLEKGKVNLYRRIFFVKTIFQDAVNKSIPEPNAAYINGILLGSRQNILQDLKDAFNKTSTTHILAISGYNIMIISDVVLMVLVLFIRRKRAFWISTVLIILFTILTGASASVVRAAIMGLLLLFASGYGRLYDVKNSIILAGAVMVFANPFVLSFDVGFQLSFLSVLGLVYVYPILDYRLRKVPKLGGVKGIVLMSLSAQAAVFPLLIYYFKNFSLVSLPANVLVLPFVPYAMLIGFLAGVGGIVFTPLGQLLGFIAWAITSYQIRVVEFLGSLNFASIALSFNWQTMLGVYLILLVIFFKLSNKLGIHNAKE